MPPGRGHIKGFQSNILLNAPSTSTAQALSRQFLSLGTAAAFLDLSL